MRRLTVLITTLAFALSGLILSPAQAAVPVPADGTYLCTTGVASSATPNYTITNGAVSAGGSCTGAAVIPDGVTSIGVNAFYYAFQLTSINIPDGVTSIGVNAFYYAFQLTSINIPDGVTSIGISAFEFSGLTSITIPASVTSMGKYALRGTSSLVSITVDNANANFSSAAGVLFNKASTQIIVYPAKKNGTAYAIPATVTSIGNDAFRSTSLTNISIPSSVTSIGDSAFSNANSLTNVTIPASVTRIGQGAFYFMLTLANVYFLGDAPPTVGDFNFYGSPGSPKAYIKSAATGFGSAGGTWNLLVVTVGFNTVSYDTNSGSSVSDQGFVGDVAEPATPTRTGYTFAGWSATDGGSDLTFPYTPASNSDVTLFAKWASVAAPAPQAANSTPNVVAPAASTSKTSSANLPKFESGSSALTKSQKTALKKLVDKSGLDATFAITGAASRLPDVSDLAVNALAKERGKAVKAYLVKLGVSKSQIKIKVKISDEGIVPKTKVRAKYLLVQ